MTNEKAFAAYALLGHVADDMIVDALLPEDRGAGVAPANKERPRRLSAFLESGWGVGIICALVAVSVMGGIIWAGNRPGPVTPPAGTAEPESDPVTQEILTDESQESPAETSEPVTVFVPTEITRSCTLRTDGSRYEWGGNNVYVATLISTVPGAILDIGEESWQLLNLDTDEYVKVTWAVMDSDDTSQGDRTLLSPASPTDLGWYYRVLQFDWETTPPGRYRLTYTGTELSEGEEYPYYDFEVYYDVEWVEVTDRCTIRTAKDRYEWGKEKLATYTVDLTCTVAGVILDISKYDFELVNLGTGKPATVIYMKTTAHVDTSKAYPTAPDAFAQRQKTFLFDWETTPPGHYRLTYKGMELSEGEEYPYCDFEIYTPEPRMAVWDGDTYVIPAEALRWMEAWDDASQTMTGSESPGWGDIEYFLKYHLLEVPVMDVAPDADIRVAGAEITRCEIYHSDGEIVYQGDSWEAAMECALKTPANTACYVVFKAYWRGDYVAEANAYEGRVYEYAFCLAVRDR